MLALALFIAAPHIGYSATEERSPWQPIEPADVSATVEHAALEVLTKTGVLSLDKTEPGGKYDYLLTISGRMLDESEAHTVYLGFEPVGDQKLGSFRASDTVTIGKLERNVMIKMIDGSARAAAQKLATVLKQALAGGSGDEPALPDNVATPWKWPDVTVPPVAGHGEDLQSPDSRKRAAALRELTSQALSQTTPRLVLENCALTHKDPETRLGCVKALRPFSRKLAPTQRVIIEVFRKDKENRITEEASEQMLYYSGLARDEAIQAWLEAASKARDYGPLKQLGDVANIDIVISHCLVAAGQREKYQRSKSACLELMSSLPQNRRKAILWRFIREQNPDSPAYLEGAGEREGSIGTDWQHGVNLILDDARRFEPGLEDVLWKRYERWISSFALDELAEEAPPTDTLVQHLVQALQGAQASRALRGLHRIAKEEPKLRGKVRDAVAELQATSGYNKSIQPRDLDEFMKETERMK